MRKKRRVSAGPSNIESVVPVNESRYFSFPSPMNLVLRKSTESSRRIESKRSGNERVAPPRKTEDQRETRGNRGRGDWAGSLSPSLNSLFSTVSRMSCRATEHGKFGDSDKKVLGWSADFGECDKQVSAKRD